MVSIVTYGLSGYQNGQKSELGKQFVKYIGEARNNGCSVTRVVLTCVGDYIWKFKQSSEDGLHDLWKDIIFHLEDAHHSEEIHKQTESF